MGQEQSSSRPLRQSGGLPFEPRFLEDSPSAGSGSGTRASHGGGGFSVPSGAVFAPNERFAGLRNFHNTCYANSVLQCLRACAPLRRAVLRWGRDAERIRLAALAQAKKGRRKDFQHQQSPSKDTADSNNTSKPSMFRSLLRTISGSDASTEEQQRQDAEAALLEMDHFLTGGGAAQHASHVGEITREERLQTLVMYELYCLFEAIYGDGTLYGSSSTSGGDSPSRGARANRAHQSTPPSSAKHLPRLVTGEKRDSSATGGCLSMTMRCGGLAPRGFLLALKQANVAFQGVQQQDSHELFNFLLNCLDDALIAAHKLTTSPSPGAPLPSSESAGRAGGADTGRWRSFVRHIFEGTLANETQCLECETVSRRDEPFLELSVDVEQNTSLTGALRNLARPETLRGNNKFFCDRCMCPQEAHKHTKIARLPPVLVLHLKRFCYTMTDYDVDPVFEKKGLRVPFPLSLRVPTEALTQDAAADPRQRTKVYELFGIVVHLGASMTSGHYIALVRVPPAVAPSDEGLRDIHDGDLQSRWIQYDDEIVTEIADSRQLRQVFGATDEVLSSDRHRTDTGYLLFFQEVASTVAKGEEVGTTSVNFDPLPEELSRTWSEATL